jgi:hypothetical protein
LQSAFSGGKTHCEQHERPGGQFRRAFTQYSSAYTRITSLPPVPVTDVCLQKPRFLKKSKGIHDFLTIINEKHPSEIAALTAGNWHL